MSSLQQQQQQQQQQQFIQLSNELGLSFFLRSLKAS